MASSNTDKTVVIIGGTIKAATSSVFTYLSAHPDVCASSIKETLFFTHKRTGDPARDLMLYMEYFDCADEASVLIEASPSYLGYIENVAPCIHEITPHARLLFILRNPVDRVYSHFNFARGKLELPQGMAFETYIDLCEKYLSGALKPTADGIPLQHLRGLEIGRYCRYLKNYYDTFGAPQISVMFYDDLHSDPVRFMRDVCEFAGLDGGFFESYLFRRTNVTFTSKRRGFHALAMSANRALERTLRRRPLLKQALVANLQGPQSGAGWLWRDERIRPYQTRRVLFPQQCRTS